jgi:hypothetical protein
MGDPRFFADLGATRRSNSNMLVAIETICSAWEDTLPEHDSGAASVLAMLVRAIDNNRGLYRDSPQHMETVRSVFCHLCRRAHPEFLRACHPTQVGDTNCVIGQTLACLDAEGQARKVGDQPVGYPQGM